MDTTLKQAFTDAVIATLKTAEAAGRTARQIARLFCEAHLDVWNQAAPSLALDGLTEFIRKRRGKLADPRQLPLPGFEHVTTEVGGVETMGQTLEQFRRHCHWLDRRIDGTQKWLALARAELRELRRMERECAPFFAGSPTMTMTEARELYEASTWTKIAERNRKIARTRKVRST